MKRKILAILIFILALTTLFLIGCDSEGTITVDKIAIKEGTEFSTSIGKFDCLDYTLVLTKDGEEFYEPLTLDMISASDVMNFYKEGSYTITVNAYGQTCEFKLNVAENEFSDYLFEDIKVEYTGETFFAEVKGNLPQGTVVFYPDGNSFSEVGKYSISAVLTCNNYKTEVVYADVEITPARYDISGVKFEDAVFDYDGSPKSIYVTGDIPEGVTVVYKIDSQYTNSRTNANEAGYEVTASFLSSNVNYEPIDDLTARLYIRKANYDLSEIEIEDRVFGYTGESHSVYFDEEDKLPEGVVFSDVSATYVDINGDTQTINSENVLIKNTAKKVVTLKDAYDYTIRYSFSVTDTNNYNLPAPIESKFTINKVVYKLEGVSFSDEAFVYDGKPKSIAVSGALSDDLEVVYKGNGCIKVGEYEVTANFIVKKDPVNYTAPESMTAKIYISKAMLVLSPGDFNYEEDIPYSGDPITPDISVILPEGLAFKMTFYTRTTGSMSVDDGDEIGNATEIGAYFLKLQVSGDALSNYYEIDDVTLPFNITRRTFDTSKLYFKTQFDYDGKLHYPEAQGLPDGLKVNYDKSAVNVSDGKVAVTATFEPIDDDYKEHYVLPSPIKTSVEIKPIEYKRSYKFVMNDATSEYDGEKHFIEGVIEGEYMADVALKDVVSIDYTMTRNDLNRVFEGNGATEVGEYVITATISMRDNKNYYFPQYSANLTITFGKVKISDIEKAIFVKEILNAKVVVFDKEKLGDNYFVYNDFLGYYEKNGDGSEGVLFTEPIEWSFGTHEVYLKFAPSELYKFVDDLGAPVTGYAPHMTVEMDQDFVFEREYDVTVTTNSVSIIEVRYGKTKFAELRLLKDPSIMMTKIKSFKLIYKNDDAITYDVETITENGVTYFYMPAVTKLGDYELKFEIEFLNDVYNGSVGVVFDHNFTVSVNKATDTECQKVIRNAFDGKDLFKGSNGEREDSYTYCDLGMDVVLKDKYTISVNENLFGSADAPYTTEFGEFYFTFGKFKYRYRKNESDDWSELPEVSTNSLELTKEGFYSVYFKPEIHDVRSGEIFTVESLKMSQLPVVELLLHYETHDVSDDVINGYSVFETTGNWIGPSTFGGINESEKYEFHNYSVNLSPEALAESALDRRYLPFYASITVSDAVKLSLDGNLYLSFTLTVSIDGSTRHSKTVSALLKDARP